MQLLITMTMIILIIQKLRRLYFWLFLGTTGWFCRPLLLAFTSRGYVAWSVMAYVGAKEIETPYSLPFSFSLADLFLFALGYFESQPS